MVRTHLVLGETSLKLLTSTEQNPNLYHVHFFIGH
jgi:hypothetical protein